MTYNVTISRQSDIESPRTEYSPGIMVCHHGRYELGDSNANQELVNDLEAALNAVMLLRRPELAKQGYSCLDEQIPCRKGSDILIENPYYISGYLEYQSLQAAIETYTKYASLVPASLKIIFVPLYLYEHGDISISTSRFSCKFDSGQTGWIYITLAKLNELGYRWKRLSANRLKKAIDLLTEEVFIYDQYLAGDVFQFDVEDCNGNVIDSCGGFYGSDFDSNGMKDHLSGDLWQAARTSMEHINC